MSELTLAALAADTGVTLAEITRQCRAALERKIRLAPPAKLKDRTWCAPDGWPARNAEQGTGNRALDAGR